MSDYSFIKEVIKERPVNKKKICIIFTIIIFAAVLFGVIAAFTFAYTLPYAQEDVQARKKPGKVDFPEDKEVFQSETPTPIPTPQVKETPEIVEVPAKVGLPEYKQINEDMKKATQRAQSAIVTVIGIKEEVDYFNNTYDNPGQLSGVIIANNNKELLILTEHRVIAEADRIQVTFADGRTVDAAYQKHDGNTNLAVLKIPLESVAAETMNEIVMAPLGNSYGLKQGEPVIALGSPMGYGNSMAFGMVTSVTNTISTVDTEYALVTTDILGSKEGSGVLVNLDGEIVGIMAQNYSTENNAVTALSISGIKQLIQTLSNNGSFSYAGIKGQVVTEEISQKQGIPKGVYIADLAPDSPAVQGGLWKGDIIVQIGDKKVTTIAEYHQQLELYKDGEVVPMVVMRGSAQGYQEKIFDVIVQAR